MNIRQTQAILHLSSKEAFEQMLCFPVGHKSV